MSEEIRDVSYLPTSDFQQMGHGSQLDGYQEAAGYPQAVGYQPVPTGQQHPGYSQTIGYQPYSAPARQLHYAQPAYQPSMVILQPGAPQTIMTVPQQSNPDNCVIPALITCLFCFFPTGLAALYYASRTTQLLAEGDITEARNTSEKTRNLVIASVIIGVVCYAMALFLRVFLGL